MLCGEESRSIILTMTPDRRQRAPLRQPPPPPPAPAIPMAVGRAGAASAPAHRFCTACGAAIMAQQQFCTGCGRRLV
jgi:hypothetical protein